MAIVISDHMDQDVDFYVPPGYDATSAIQEALILSQVYGVAHLVIRGRLYVYAAANPPFVLDQSLHYIFEGDGLGEIDYVNPSNLSNPSAAFTISTQATAEMNYASTNAAVSGVTAYSTYGWIIAFKNMRLLNLTGQRWFFVSSFPFGPHSTMFYFDAVQFFASFWLNQTATVVVNNCYFNNAEFLLDTQSREAVIMSSRFENEASLAISPRGWAVIGCVFLSSITSLNPGVDGNNGSVIACVFDYSRIVTQGANNLRLVACQFQNVSFSGNPGYVQLSQGVNYAIVGCAFEGDWSVQMTDLWGSPSSLFIAFNTFDFGSSLVIQIRDGTFIDSIVIMGNTFISSSYHSSLIFITGNPAPGQSTAQLTGYFKMLWIAFNTFITQGGTVLPFYINNSQIVYAQGYINVALSGTYAFIAFNYFENNNGTVDQQGQVLGAFSLQQLTSNVTGIKNLFFYFNVNENNPVYLPSTQSYTAQFNVGI